MSRWIGSPGYRRQTGRPVTFGAVVGDTTVETLHKVMRQVAHANANGAYLVPQIAARPAAALMGLEASVHPFITHRAFRPLSKLNLEQKVAKLRDPVIRAQILADVPAVKEALTLRMVTNFDNYFQLGDPPDYEPSREMSIARRAQRQGRTPQELTYDIMLERGGRELIYMPFTYLDYSLESNREMMLDTGRSPRSGRRRSALRTHLRRYDANLPAYLFCPRPQTWCPAAVGIRRQASHP